MIALLSLFPLFAGLLSVALACAALFVPHRGSRTVCWFVALNLSVTLWSLSAFVHMNWSPYADPALAPAGSAAHLLLVLYALGLGGTLVSWPMFAATNARSPFWTSRRGILLALAPGVYTFAVAVSNPWHRLFMRPVEGAVAGGPLAAPHYVSMTIIMTIAIWLTVTASMRLRTRSGSRQGLALGIASALPLAGGVFAGIARSAGLPLPLSPPLMVYAGLSAVLAYEVVFRGYAGIVPLAAFASALSQTRVPVAYLDASFNVLAVSPAFLEELGRARHEVVHTGFFDAFPTLGDRSAFERSLHTGAVVKSDRLTGEGRAAPGRWDWSLTPVGRRSDVHGFILRLFEVAETVPAEGLERILDVLSELEGSRSADDALLPAVAEAAALLGCDSARLVLHGERGWMVAECGGGPVEWVPFDLEGCPHIAHALQMREPFVTSDARHDDRQAGRAMLERGVRAAIAVPLVQGGTPLGAVSFELRSSVARFTETHLACARRVASALSAAVSGRAETTRSA